MRTNRLTHWLLLVVFGIASAQAQQADSDDPWNDAGWDDDAWEEEGSLWEEPEDQFPLTGFIEGAYGERTRDNPVIDQDDTLNEVRLRLEANKTLGKFDLRGKADIYRDEFLQENSARVREAYFFVRATQWLDLSVGRQILTWGHRRFIILERFVSQRLAIVFRRPRNVLFKSPQRCHQSQFFHLKGKSGSGDLPPDGSGSIHYRRTL